MRQIVSHLHSSVKDYIPLWVVATDICLGGKNTLDLGLCLLIEL